MKVQLKQRLLRKFRCSMKGGEIGIFEAIGANAAFYAKVISGSQMPRLIYMTTYADMKSHDECWASIQKSSRLEKNLRYGRIQEYNFKDKSISASSDFIFRFLEILSLWSSVSSSVDNSV